MSTANPAPPALPAPAPEKQRWGINEWGSLASIVGAAFWVYNYLDQRAREREAAELVSAMRAQQPPAP